MNDFQQKGWTVFSAEPRVEEWAVAAQAAAVRALNDPELDRWYECRRTWFVGLDALANDDTGRVAGSAPLSGSAVDFIADTCGGWPALHRAQVSAVFPGYPAPRDGESDAGFRYRLKRDAAHVDGVIGIGTPKRRFVLEPHAFILGLPLTAATAEAAPLVAWEGSHRIMSDAFRTAFATMPDGPAEDIDVTDIYTHARAHVFETCRRVILHGPPGSAIVLHRHILHGVAPWAAGARAAPEGRIIAYFRPPMPGGARAWAEAE
jgi:hypothetical protein